MSWSLSLGRRSLRLCDSAEVDQSAARSHLFPIPHRPQRRANSAALCYLPLTLDCSVDLDPSSSPPWLTTRLQHPGPQARVVVVAVVVAAEGLLSPAVQIHLTTRVTEQAEAPDLADEEAKALVDATRSRVPLDHETTKHSPR